MAYEQLHFFKWIYEELIRMKIVYGGNYSRACIRYMGMIAKWLRREIKLYEKEKGKAQKGSKGTNPGKKGNL